MEFDPHRHAFCEVPDEAVLQRARRIRLLVLDVDGVLTDGGIYIGADGELMKAFHIQDGKGLKMLQEAGVEVALLTGRSSPHVLNRAAELGITRVLQGRQHKWEALQDELADLGLTPEQVAFVGDDLIDLPVACRVGLAVSVPAAHPWLAEHCHWQTRRAGGDGAVREVSEMILLAQGRLAAMLQAYATI